VVERTKYSGRRAPTTHPSSLLVEWTVLEGEGKGNIPPSYIPRVPLLPLQDSSAPLTPASFHCVPIPWPHLVLRIQISLSSDERFESNENFKQKFHGKYFSQKLNVGKNFCGCNQLSLDSLLGRLLGYILQDHQKYKTNQGARNCGSE
jgi:hypothetical protein